jgi:hypothetical protein
MMDYLNQDDPILRGSEEKRIFAVAELLMSTLEYSDSYRMEFDGARLRHVIGSESMERLMPKYPLVEGKQAAHKYDFYADIVDTSKRELLQQVLSLTVAGGYVERPLNYIESVRFLDKDGVTILRGGDHNNFILFRLPENVRASLLTRYRERGIPDSVIKQVDVDVESLEP